MRYRAFFSYARADDKLANWLHRQLDGYRTPKALIGQDGAFGPVPAKLFPIYRDRTDQDARGHLDQRLQEALRESECLIVLCTPTSAKSQWVNHECDTFLRLGREDRIFPVIGAGEPNSGDPETECFPPALRGKGLLAADLREIKQPNGRVIGDGRDGGRLKLIAGMLGVELDSLIRRERSRQRILVSVLATAAAAFLAVAAAALVQYQIAEANRREASVQRLRAESERNEAVRQRDAANARLEFARGSFSQVVESLMKIDVRASNRSNSQMFSFSGVDGGLPCAALEECTGDARAFLFDDARALAVNSAGGATDPAASAAFQQFCDLVDSSSNSNALQIVEACEGRLPKHSSHKVGIVEIGSDWLVTRYAGSGWCGSGGCADQFLLWRKRKQFRVLVSCEGDAFAIRFIGGSPTTAYCYDAHKAGCASRAFHFGFAVFDNAANRFMLGPSMTNAEEREDSCEDATTVLRWDTENPFGDPGILAVYN